MRRIRQNRGFTLIEMMIVISLILILISIGVPMYGRAILRAKESTLRQDLFTLRDAIEQYTLDKQKAPQSLDDLKQANYIRDVPKDPFTGEANWTVDQEDSVMAVDQTQPGVSDVHSSSSLVGTDGTAYSSW